MLLEGRSKSAPFEVLAEDHGVKVCAKAGTVMPQVAHKMTAGSEYCFG